MFKPFISSDSNVTEFTFRAILLGALLGLLFGVGNAYLALRVGTTVSASIPAAVLSMTLLRIFFTKVSILENNLVQTIASVGEALAGGIVFTVPALFLMGEHPSLSRIFLLSSLGGILGILFMIPMRRYIIVKEHGTLPFPEGTACAAILKSGETGRSKALMAFIGILIGALHKVCSSALNLWREAPTWIITPFQKTEFTMDCTPSLLGVGFIIGPRTSAIIFAGGALAWWVIIPLITMFGVHAGVIFPATVPLAEMSAEDIWSKYVRYIGAGTIAVGGLIGFFRVAPLIAKTFHVGIKELFQGVGKKVVSRTDRDISLRWLILGSIAIILTLWLFPGLPMNFLTILLITILGFFFVAVTSLMAGIVGSTSNPVSGMTITTLLITCLIFVGLGWTERAYLISALTMAVVVNVAIALAGATSQDLKTGYIVGATPRWQQIGEIIGILLPALSIGGTLYLLNEAYGIGSKQMPAPQGTMMALIAQGVIHGDIPYTLVGIGAVIGLFIATLKLPVLPFAIGLYLPFSFSTSMLIGGLTAALVKRLSKNPSSTDEMGIIASSGLIAGDACTGVVIALFTVLGWVNASASPLLPDYVALLVYFLLALALGWFALRPPKFMAASRK